MNISKAKCRCGCVAVFGSTDRASGTERDPGLLPFHLGAFSAAVAADRPIAPIAVQGTRRLLPDQQWLPRRSSITVHIGSRITTPHGKNAFAATIQLRDAARRYMLDHCGEAELG